MQHRDDALFPALFKKFLKSRYGSAEFRVFRFKDIISPEFLKCEFVQTDRLFQSGIVARFPGCAVKGLVVENDHPAVFRQVHIALYAGIASSCCLCHGRYAVLGNYELTCFVLAPASPVREGVDSPVRLFLAEACRGLLALAVLMDAIALSGCKLEDDRKDAE